ncbi:uncharacterized protein MYCFIDRAFT_79931 [Pseudocercospora fijiensis CIRAD86]|uniref:Uncharacterized protein n=1 Tax=Pseudocercospora fijiensis (strain CIRAD86) TaxID=383855 RepID=M3A7Z9_PSEFD|nr:uncharacterized protein MYCFIDRAFT_79931 [Pseudocercospora fijiensis CIRAD86]EME80731.1 hypothetical protein MYCFIDRAFT_79931 [Pseudocercospora fijiensis CIRAD86]
MLENGHCLPPLPQNQYCFNHCTLKTVPTTFTMTIEELTTAQSERVSVPTMRLGSVGQDTHFIPREGRDETHHLQKSILALAHEVYINTVSPNATRESLLSAFSLRAFRIPSHGHPYHRIVLATREPGHMVVSGAPHAEIDGAHRLLYDAVMAWRDHAKRRFGGGGGAAEWLDVAFEGMVEWDGEFAMGTYELMRGDLGDRRFGVTLALARDGHRDGFRSPGEFQGYMFALMRWESGRGGRGVGGCGRGRGTGEVRW